MNQGLANAFASIVAGLVESFVVKTRKVCGKDLSADVTLEASDVGAASLEDGLVPVAQLPAATAFAAGMQSAADQAAGNLSATITNSGGAAVGDLVRLVAPGILAKAQADTVAHAAALVGVWNGTTVVPLNGFRVINCVAAPTAGPLYMSAVVGGKAENVAPPLGISPVGNVVADVSVGAAFAALVSCPYQPILQPSSLKEKLDVETLALLGGTPLEWDDAIFDHFGQTVVTATGVPAGQVADKRAPLWGNKSAAVWTDSYPSSVTLATGANNIWYLSSPSWTRLGVAPLAYPWRLTVKLKMAANSSAGTQIDWYDDTGHSYVQIQGDAAGHFAIVYGKDAAAVLLAVGANDGTTPVEVSVASKGDGTLIYKFGATGAWSAPVSDAATASLSHAIAGGVLYCLKATSAAPVTLDYIYFRQKMG
jgi:hypothetical protein